jgi:hypothetical protein
MNKKNLIIGISVSVFVVILTVILLVEFLPKNSDIDPVDPTATEIPEVTPTPVIDDLPVPNFSVIKIVNGTEPFVSLSFDGDHGVSIQMTDGTGLIQFWRLDNAGVPEINPDITIISPSNFYASTQSASHVYTFNGVTYAVVSGFTSETILNGIILTYQYYPERDGWELLSSFERPFSTDDNDQFGTQLSFTEIENDLYLICSSLIGTTSDNGAIYVFKFVNPLWVFENQLIEQVIPELNFGSCITSAGTTLVVASRDTGILRHYEFSDSEYSLVDTIISTGDQCRLSYNGYLAVANGQHALIYTLTDGMFQEEPTVSTQTEPGFGNTLSTNEYAQYIIGSNTTKTTVLNRSGDIFGESQLLDVIIQPNELNCECGTGQCFCQNPNMVSLLVEESTIFILAIDYVTPLNIIVYSMNY